MGMTRYNGAFPFLGDHPHTLVIIKWFIYGFDENKKQDYLDFVEDFLDCDVSGKI